MTGPISRSGMLEQLDLTEEERKFIESSNTAVTANMNQSRIVSEVYLAKSLDRATNMMVRALPNEAIRVVRALHKITDRVIDSNRRLTESNEEHATKMARLTVALLIFAAVEAIATAVSALIALGVIGP